MSTSTEYMDGLNAPVERRFYPRVTPPTPIYVAFGPNNLGVLHNVSENGFQVATPSELPLNSVYRVFLTLNGAAKTISVTVRTIWTDDADRRSGIQLLDLADEDRQQIRKWIVFELSRSENANAWYLPKNGERNSERSPVESNTTVRQPLPPAPEVASATAPSVAAPADAAPEVPRQAAQTPRSPRVTLPSREAQPAVTGKPSAAAQPAPAQAAAQRPAAKAQSAPSQPAAKAATDLPPIANPFDDPGPNSPFQQFPSVPLPIHGEFEYGKPASNARRRSKLSSSMRAKPLIAWAVVLALVCFGANELVRYKIKRSSQHFAIQSVKNTPTSDGTSAGSGAPVDDSGANAGAASPADTQSASDSNTDAATGNSKDQAASPIGSSSASKTTTAQDSSSLPAVPPASHSGVKDSETAQTRQRDSSLDTGGNRAYTATAPPASEETARASKVAPTPRTWSAPAPNRNASTYASDAPQSPNVESSSNTTTQSPSAPIVSQTRPTPPPAPTVQASAASGAVNSAPVSKTNSNPSNVAASSQQPSNSQSSTYASNSGANTPPARQSPIYNANAPQQRSAIIGSINSVHSSGIFDSNDTATAEPPASSRGGNANVATRSVSNGSVVPSDRPQEHDLEIVAPKSFTASWVDVPGEHVVRSAAGTVHIRRLVRVPGERLPGQRWLWRGKLNVTLGDVVNRIDPAVVQASGASGSLTIEATIDKDGYVTDLKPLYGNFAMLPSVSRAVRNWHYNPTYLDNKRAETQAQIEFDLRPTSASNRSTRP